MGTLARNGLLLMLLSQKNQIVDLQLQQFREHFYCLLPADFDMQAAMEHKWY